MKMQREDLINLVNNLALLDDIKPSDIPNIDLYMEQMTTFIDEKLNHLKRDENDKILTKTMINNYTKMGILMPPKNKKYNKGHIILLILIYNLKQILSINDIHALLAPILKNIDTTEDDIISLEDIYKTFLSIKDDEFNEFSKDLSNKVSSISERLESIDNENTEIAEMFLTVIMLIAQADAQKRLAEKIIDEYFKKNQ